MADEIDPNKDKKKTATKKKPVVVDGESIKALLKSALASHSKEQHRSIEDEIGALNAVIEEFMKSFILIGYTIDENPVTIINAKTPADQDALSSSLSRLFYQQNDQQ